MKSFFPILRASFCSVVLLLAGCGTVSYSPYVGQQQDWPTSPGAFVKDMKGIPLYRGLPNRPYTVLGHVEITAEPAFIEQQAYWKAKNVGADAILFVDAQTFYAGSVGGGTAFAAPTKGGAMAFGSSWSSAQYQKQITAVFIKWK